ncbi:MAG: lipocalin family protein [Pseudomonadota bacterium]
MTRFTLILSFIVLLGSPSIAAEVKTVDRLDLQRYLGTWHEVARFPARFQRGCEKSKAEYKKISADKISVTNSCTRNGKKVVAEGNAVIQSPGFIFVDTLIIYRI